MRIQKITSNGITSSDIFKFEGQRRDFSKLEIIEKAKTWCLKIQIKHGWIFLKAYVEENQGEKYGEHQTYKLVDILTSRIQQIRVVKRQS